MIIAINIRVLSGDQAANKFLINCINQLAINHPESQFVFISNKEFELQTIEAINIQKFIIPQLSNNPVFWKLWYNYKLPSAIKKLNVDILINADGVCSLRTKQPQIVFVNDLAFIKYPQWYIKKYLRFIKRETHDFLQKATLIFSPSRFIKKEIAEQYQLYEDKIKVIPVAIDKKCKPLNWELKESTREKYSEGKEFFLFTGSVHPRSNLLNLLKAFSIFKKRQKSNMQLLIASTTEQEDDVFVSSLLSYKYRSEVKLLTDINEETLAVITGAAYGCINMAPLHSDIISLLTPIECGVPVIAGNFHIAIELLGDAALFTDASSPENIAEKLMLLYKDENRRNELIQRGFEQSKKYDISQSAEIVWQNILHTLQPA